MTIDLTIILAAILAMIPPLVAAILAFLSSRRAVAKIEQVHVIVNSQRTELLAKLDASAVHLASMASIIEELQQEKRRREADMQALREQLPDAPKGRIP